MTTVLESAVMEDLYIGKNRKPLELNVTIQINTLLKHVVG